MITDVFTAPDIKYALVAPLLIVLGGGVLSVLIEAFAPRRLRPSLPLVLVARVLLVALFQVLPLNPSDPADQMVRV